jgi:hypothetical protein
MPGDQPINIKQLYPDFTDEQLAEAEANLRRFARVLAEIYQERAGKRDLTVADSLPIIQIERSNPTNQPL